ncbi:uncharacterized protein LOC124810962 [Hydra vulgaris]|uniref:uncharacterized protein LOC124810962 n=1 Tax=Hydra vulgaris TaxID=6087 RepID=UPI001F5E5D4F|nr:uncharacterized protein LOC124810962 [Hydra vulgaris]
MFIHYSSFAILIFYYNFLILGSCTSSTIVSPAQLSAELTYEAYKIYRTQHPGPTSNKSYLRWVKFGGKDDPLFRWPYYPPKRRAGDNSRGGTGSGCARRGRQRRNGGSYYVNFNINN